MNGVVNGNERDFDTSVRTENSLGLTLFVALLRFYLVT